MAIMRVEIRKGIVLKDCAKRIAEEQIGIADTVGEPTLAISSSLLTRGP